MVFGGCVGCSTGNGLVNRSKNENMKIVDLEITQPVKKTFNRPFLN
jgi:hypothetical protein